MKKKVAYIFFGAFIVLWLLLDNLIKIENPQYKIVAFALVALCGLIFLICYAIIEKNKIKIFSAFTAGLLMLYTIFSSYILLNKFPIIVFVVSVMIALFAVFYKPKSIE